MRQPLWSSHWFAIPRWRTDDIFFGGAKAFANHLQTVKVPHVFR